MTAAEKAALRALAEEATPGPWNQWVESGEVLAGEVIENRPGLIRMKRGTSVDICECAEDDDAEDNEQHLHNAAYIAAAHPAAVLALLDEVERLREALETISKSYPAMEFTSSLHAGRLARAALEEDA